MRWDSLMNPETEPSEAGGAGTVADSPPSLSREERLRQFFLGRLVHLIRLRDGLGGGLKPEDERLVKWALYSTYRDCVSAGVGEEARAALGL